MDLQFGTATDIPATTVARESEPNPFDGHFPSDDKALPVVITAKTEDDLSKAVTKAKNQSRKAAQAVERSARAKETERAGDAKKGYTATVLFWTVPKITRARGDKADETASE